MQNALLASALLMGLFSGPHCVVMCGPLCAGMAKGCASARGTGGQALDRSVSAPDLATTVHRVQWLAATGAAASASASSTIAAPGRALAIPLWHLGRMGGYAIAGAVAAASAGALAWLAELAPAVRPLWVMLHAAVLAWGIVLLVRARPPVVGQVLSRWFESRLAASRRPAWWPFALGVSWAALPCGLLYSALMLAALADTAATGAAAMGLFAIGSGLSLVAGPAAWAWLRQRLARGGEQVAESWANRATGLLLVALAGFAIVGDVAQRVLDWCR